MRRALVIADDLTGAADSGAQFARAGWRTLLALAPSSNRNSIEPGSEEEAEVLVLTSESRGLASDTQAAEAVRNALMSYAQDSIPIIYKKIDSTLRGHPAAELAVVMQEMGETRALIAPAFPAQGRVTRAGRVWVNGSPLEDTVFSNEAPSGDLRRIFGDRVTLFPVELVREDARLKTALHDLRGLAIADAETNRDLLGLAQAALEAGIRLWCGSAGLAGALVACLGSPAGLSLPVAHLKSSGPWLAVAGSRHAATTAQVLAAQRAGAALVLPSAAFFTGNASRVIAETSARLAQSLSNGQNTILCVQLPGYFNKGDKAHDGYTQSTDASAPPTEIAARLAQMAVMALDKVTPAGLFLTGGETAHAVCRALGCTRLWLGGEVEPGIPWSRMADGRFPGLPVITKAGGFGRENSLAEAFNYFV